MAFNRDQNRGGGGGFRPRFNDRGNSSRGGAGSGGAGRGPVEMHKAVCDNCGRECEVPFRPTSGKPIFCSSCFENKREGGDSRRSFDKPRFERPNFSPVSDSQLKQQIDALNSKLDKILSILTPLVKTEEKAVEEVTQEVEVKVEKPVKKAKSENLQKTPEKVEN